MPALAFLAFLLVSAPQAPPAGLVGDATCLGCHETHGYGGTAHGRTDNPRTPAAAQGCETCHGPGKGHVDGGGDTTKIKNPGSLPIKEAVAVCSACHQRTVHPAAATGVVPGPDAACATCHSIHHAAGPKQLKAGRS